MSDFRSEMNEAVTSFVERITELARAAARDMIDQALGKPRMNGMSPRANGRGAKRSPAEIERLVDQFYAFVAKHPGLRIEQINKQLGTQTGDLALPVRKLISDGMIKTKGKKRSTTYFIVEGKKRN